MVGLDISTYSGKYDGEYHALEVINASGYPTTIISKTEEDNYHIYPMVVLKIYTLFLAALAQQ